MKKKNLIFLSIIAVAINMRLPITAIPPVLGLLQQATGIPTSQLGWLTTIPLLTFAIISPILAKLGNRFGNELVIFTFLIILTIGSFLRINFSVLTIILGTLLIGIGIDAGNVLLPAVIKDKLPDQEMVGMATYITSMLVIGAVGTAFSGITTELFSLKTTMIILAIITFISLIGWFPQLKKSSSKKEAPTTNTADQIQPVKSVWVMKLGWLITIFFGLQSLLYYSLITWLPSMFNSLGFSNIEAGIFVTILQVGSLPCSFIVPLFAAKGRNSFKLIWVLGVGFVFGLLGLLFPIHNFIWVSFISLLIGIGSGVAFNLSVIFFAQKSKTAVQTANVSGMAQSFGYLLAAIGPILFGYLNNLTNNWNLVLVLSIIVTFILLITGLLIEKEDYLK
ncbi:MFS transporter [Fructilactobacillus vespulae]|uniref:MFS transporter n=1 Tax=Fructilactobacillus vespulae TaxID=1249630 RepID=UPI0039B382B7